MFGWRLALAGFVAASVAACTSTGPPVPVWGDAAGIEALEGRWEGEYSSRVTGRSGTISFELVAGEEAARGSVFMVPREERLPSVQDERHGPRSLAQSQRLSITFVRVEGGRVEGRLDPYLDPQCGCTLRTVFQGRLRGDAIEGTFVSEIADSGDRFTGRWKAVRKAGA
jgi:hypothetical protein